MRILSHPATLVFLLLLVVVLFGYKRLPDVAKSVGQSMKAFRNEMKTDDSAGSGDTKSTGESSESAKDSAPSDKS